jgi:hypothetical protein
MVDVLENDFLLHNIFGFLNVFDIPNIARVSHRFARAAQHDDVWREILPSDLPFLCFGRAPLPLRSVAKVIVQMYQNSSENDHQMSAANSSTDSFGGNDNDDDTDDGGIAVRVCTSAAHDRNRDLFRCSHAPGQQLAAAALMCSSSDNDQAPGFTLEDRYFWSSVGRVNPGGREFIIYQLGEPACWVTGVRFKAASLRRVYGPLQLSATVGMTLADVLPNDTDTAYWDDGDNFGKRTTIDSVKRVAVGPLLPTVMPPVACASSFAWQSFQFKGPVVGGFVRIDFIGFPATATHFVGGMEHLHYHCISSVVVAGYRGSRLPPELCAASLNLLLHPSPRWRNSLQAGSLRTSAASIVRAFAFATVHAIVSHVQLLQLFLARRGPGFVSRPTADPDLKVLLDYLACCTWLDGVLDDADTEEGAVDAATRERIEAALLVARNKPAEQCQACFTQAKHVYDTLSHNRTKVALLFEFVLNRPFMTARTDEEEEQQQQQQLDGAVTRRRRLAASLTPVSDGADALLATRLLIGLRELHMRATASRQ